MLQSWRDGSASLEYVLVSSFYHCDKHHDQKGLGEERAYFIFQLTANLQWKPWQETGVWNWSGDYEENTAHWLALHGSLGLLSYTAQDYPPTQGLRWCRGLGPPPSLTNEEDAPQTFWCRHFLPWQPYDVWGWRETNRRLVCPALVADLSLAPRDPHEEAHNCLALQLQGIWCPLLNPGHCTLIHAHTHTYICTHNKNI